MHVFARGRFDTAESPYSSSCRKSIDGIGWKPIGGITLPWQRQGFAQVWKDPLDLKKIKAGCVFMAEMIVEKYKF